MRMPVMRYFVVVGSALLGLLLLTNGSPDSNGPALKTSQTVGLPQSAKIGAEPVSTVAPVSTDANFAAAYEPPQPKSAEAATRTKAAEKKRKEKTVSKNHPAWHRFVAYPFGTFSIR